MLPSLLLALFTLLQVALKPVQVTGRIVDPEGRPVEGARVSIFPVELDLESCARNIQSPACYEALTQRGLLRGVGLTGPDGRFTITIPGGLRGNDYILATGKDLKGVDLANSWPIAPNRKLSSPDLGDVELSRWRELLIRVRSDGNPVPEAKLDFGFGDSLITDKNGELHHGSYREGGEDVIYHIGFSVRAKGFAVEARNHGLRAGTATITVDLVKDIPLNGRALGPDAQPLSNAVVTVRPTESWQIVMTRPHDDQVTQVSADAEGFFTARGLRLDREYRLSVEAPAQLALVRADLIVKASAKPVEVRLAPSGEVLVEGEFPPKASAYSDRALLERQELNRPRGPIALERMNVATGKWEDAGALLRVEQVGPGSFRIRFTQVPPGPVRVTVEGWSGVADDVSEPFPATVGIVAPVSVKLVMAQTIQLRVIDTKGNPVSGAEVEWPLPRAHSGSWQYTDEEGRAEIKIHPDRDVPIRVTSEGGIQTQITVRAGVTPPPVVLPSR